MRSPRVVTIVGSLLLFGAAPAGAAVFAEKSPEQKLRADVARQVTSYTKCLATALIACEKTGVSPGPECTLASATALSPADPKGKFAAAIAKCDASLDYDRKGPKGNSSVQNYELIGCPSATSPTRLADMDALEEIARDAKPVLDTLNGLLASVSGCVDNKSCRKAAQAVVTFATVFGKCETACENDYKNKKGNGGTDDSVLRCGPGGDPKAASCVAKARAKFLVAAAAWPLGSTVAGFVESTIDEQTDALFNVAPNCF